MSESKVRAKRRAAAATQPNGYFQLRDLPPGRDWIGELIDNTSMERIRSRFPAVVLNRFGKYEVADRDEAKLILRRSKASTLLVAIANGVPVGVCECKACPDPSVKRVSLDIITSGGNHLPAFVAEVKRQWPGYKVGGGTPAIGDVATHRLYFRHLDYLESCYYTHNGLVAGVWDRDGSIQNMIEPGMDSTQLVAGYLKTTASLLSQNGVSPIFAQIEALRVTKVTLGDSRHNTSMAQVINHIVSLARQIQHELETAA